MKFVYTALLLSMIPLANANASDNVYVGVGAGVVGLNQDKSVDFPDGVSLTPDSSAGIGQFFVGYRFASNWGVELAYQQFSSDDSKSQHIDIKTEREWDAELTAKQFIIKPVYFWQLAPAWTLKSGLGVVYSDYEFSGNSHDEIEIGFDNDIEQGRGSVSHSDKAWGAIGSVGVEYAINDNWVVGTEASFVTDNLVSNYQLLANVVYHF